MKKVIISQLTQGYLLTLEEDRPVFSGRQMDHREYAVIGEAELFQKILHFFKGSTNGLVDKVILEPRTKDA